VSHLDAERATSSADIFRLGRWNNPDGGLSPFQLMRAVFGAVAMPPLDLISRPWSNPALAFIHIG
jgi:hypothetical protein